MAPAAVLVPAGVRWYVVRRPGGGTSGPVAYGPGPVACGPGRGQAELAEQVVRYGPCHLGLGANRRAGYGRMNDRAGRGTVSVGIRFRELAGAFAHFGTEQVSTT
ncbi:hypothetical protein GCM10010508_21600 [Streptomyces naganishii JCM 4654]|uniref:Uncharacterized protein n=1 Tax=Streptomyces naganishii JCM 4654 TaxID=1306179 RepID=A0A919CW76_9ACTN|nr:hypothetical protein GCM10010508_21600 [Streptomyces naganishii JCM 4654]